MREQPSAHQTRLSGTVRGLGVSDALRLELEPLQLAPLRDAVSAMARALELELERCAEVPATSDPRALEAQASAEYELRLAVMLRDRLAAGEHQRPIAIVAPTAMAVQLVTRCARDATAALAALVAVEGPGAADAHAELELRVAAAAAWVCTLLDCRVIEAFRFDPAADPGLPW